MKRLLEIQQQLKAPKNQFNDFGKYKYRSCEDILGALKPLLKEKNLVLLLDDDVISQGDRNYIQATAKLCDIENGKVIASTTALAREEETKKGMDASQITGSSSSYARKYALCGMFLIDDGIDADSTNKGDDKNDENKQEKPRFNEKELDNFTKKVSEYKTFDDGIKEIKKYYRISKDNEEKVRKLYDNLKTINQ